MSVITLRAGNTDNASSTTSSSVDIVFPRTTGWTESSPIIAQLISVPATATNNLIIKVPLTIGLDVALTGVAIDFDYIVKYTIPSGYGTVEKTEQRSYRYFCNDHLRAVSPIVNFTLKKWVDNDSTFYGLNGAVVKSLPYSVDTAISELKVDGNIGYTSLIMTGPITPGWYWLCIPTRYAVNGDSTQAYETTSMLRLLSNIRNSILRNANLAVPANATYTGILFNDVDSLKNAAIVKIVDAFNNGVGNEVKMTATEGYCPSGLGPSVYTAAGIKTYIMERSTTTSFTGQKKPALALNAGTDTWIYPSNERYVLANIASDPANTNYDVYVRFSLKGDPTDDTTWTDWESFYSDSGIGAKGVKANQNITSITLGGNDQPGTKRIYIEFKRVVRIAYNIETQYCVYAADIYYSGDEPIITSVTLEYYMSI